MVPEGQFRSELVTGNIFQNEAFDELHSVLIAIIAAPLIRQAELPSPVEHSIAFGSLFIAVYFSICLARLQKVQARAMPGRFY
jgi:hypothetical protein